MWTITWINGDWGGGKQEFDDDQLPELFTFARKFQKSGFTVRIDYEPPAAPTPNPPKPKDVRRTVSFTPRVSGGERFMGIADPGRDGQVVEIGPGDIVLALSEDEAVAIRSRLGNERSGHVTARVYMALNDELNRRCGVTK